MPAADKVIICLGTSACTLCPTIGGSISSWAVDGQDMFRRADLVAITTRNPLQMSSFPLVPYSNRIGYARFPWNGRQIELTPNFPPEQHAIHGIGWNEAWTVSNHNDSDCRLTLQHAADSQWPWAFKASQQFEIGADYLKIDLNVTNLSDETAPFAFGHHPYFDVEAAKLTFEADSVFMAGTDALPTAAVKPSGQFDFRSGALISGRDIDHCYTGWNGHARIEWAGRKRALEIEADMPAAVVYIPKDGTAFCFEPVPHMNNALNCVDGFAPMPKIDAGCAFATTITFRAISL